MEFAIRHFVAGRVRLYVPSLCRLRPLAEASLAWLRAQAGVKRARINYDCSSLVVEYDVAHEPLLRAIVGRLALMDLDDLRALVTPAGNQDCKPSLVAGAAHRPEASPSRYRCARRSRYRLCRCCSHSAPIRSSAPSTCR